MDVDDYRRCRRSGFFDDVDAGMKPLGVDVVSRLRRTLRVTFESLTFGLFYIIAVLDPAAILSQTTTIMSHSKVSEVRHDKLTDQEPAENFLTIFQLTYNSLRWRISVWSSDIQSAFVRPFVSGLMEHRYQ